MHALSLALQEKGVVKSAAVLDAFRSVPRHLFVPRYWKDPQSALVGVDPSRPTPRQLDDIYSDRALGTHRQGGFFTSSTTQPALVARMLEAMSLSAGMRVLEIGTGTGYNTALLAHVVGPRGVVCSVDIHDKAVHEARQALGRLAPSLANRVFLAARDGFEGFREFAPFDRIVATAACPDIAPSWIGQLAPDGMLLVPLRTKGLDPLVALRRTGEGRCQGRGVGWAGFMQARGALDDPAHDIVWESRDYLVSEHLRSVPLGEPIRTQFARRLDFFFYLALADPLAGLHPRGPSSDLTSIRFGILDGDTGHRALLSGTEIEYSNGSCLARVQDHLERWVQLGSPSIADYDIHVSETESGAAPRLDRPAWTMRRKHTTMVATLRKGE